MFEILSQDERLPTYLYSAELAIVDQLVSRCPTPRQFIELVGKLARRHRSASSLSVRIRWCPERALS